MVDAIDELGNPFLEETKDLLRLGTRDIVEPTVVESLQKAEKLGHEQYETFVAKWLSSQATTLSETIKKNKLKLFSQSASRTGSTSDLQLSSLRNDCALFSKLFIACQTRKGDLGEYFKHENQACPPALSQNGRLREGSKSDLLEYLESHGGSRKDGPVTEVVILDGAAMVNCLKPKSSKTFDEYAKTVVNPYVQNCLRKASRVDIIWDSYQDGSLKMQCRQKRGQGVRRRVGGATNLPENWKQFLLVSENKKELFPFLAKHITRIATTKQVITTLGSDVLCIVPRDTSRLAPCDHEEADSRQMLFLTDAIDEGYQKILIRTVDTDVVAFGIAAAANSGVRELWLSFGTDTHHRYIPAHEIAASIGPRKSPALAFFHAFTGCDTVSAFHKRGKKPAWDTWKAYDEVT